MEEVSKYCVDKRISNKNIWEIKSVNEFMLIVNKLSSMKLFRLLHKNAATKFNAAIPLYKEFLNDLATSKTTIIAVYPTKNESDEECASSVQTTQMVEYVKVSAEETKNDFYNWLFNEQKMAKASCANYTSAVKTAEEFAKTNISETCSLFSGDKSVVHQTVSELLANPNFKRKNDEQHNRYFAALKKYLVFVDAECEHIVAPQDVEKLISKAVDSKIKTTLELHYNYGFNVSSQIELLRFRNNFENDHSEKCTYSDKDLIREIASAGMKFDGKIYIIAHDVIEKITQLIDDAAEQGVVIIYFDELYNANEDWLYDGRIISAEMLREVVSVVFNAYQIKPNYVVLGTKKSTELNALKEELIRIWGGNILRTFSDLHNELPLVPFEKIKYALSYGEKYYWNSFETYANKDLFIITDEQIAGIKECVSIACDENGSVQFDELPLYDVSSENYELSETALNDIVFSYIKDSFAKNGKVIVRKGEKVEVTTALMQFCNTKETCKMAELETVMKNTTGEVRYPVIIEAANASMIRIDYNNFVADNKVMFDVHAIDTVLDDIVLENGVGLKEVTTFNAFPYCGYAWNLFLLESFCRRFSKRYRYTCITPNSRNGGAIISKNNEMDFHNIMANAIARSSTEINETDVFEFLITSGFMIKKQYANMKELLEQAAVLRDRR